MLDLLLGHLLVVAEVKAEPLRSDVGALLSYVCTQHLAECCVQKVCCCMECCGLFAVVAKTRLELSCLGSAGKLLMLCKCFVEALYIYSKAFLCSQLLGQLDWETEGVVQLECAAACNLLYSLLLHEEGHLLKLLLALLQGLAELYLLFGKLVEHFIFVLNQLWIRASVQVDYNLCHLSKECTLDAQVLAVPHCPPDKAPQYVALSYVGRGAAPLVAQDKGAGSYVVCNYAHGDIGLVVLAVLNTCQLADPLKDRLHNLGLVYALLALEDGDGPLDSHSGVDALSLHLYELALFVLVVAHEDVVPDLEVFATAAARLAVWTAGRTACVYEHLGVGAAGTGLAGRTPPVVFPWHEVDSLVRDAHAVPDLGALGVPWDSLFALEYSYRKLLWVNAQLLGQELIAPWNHLFLEVVA